MKKILSGTGMKLSAMLLSSTVVGFAASTAHATNNLNEFLKKTGGETANIPQFLTLISYLIGAVLVVLGVVRLKAHIEQPSQVPMREGIARTAFGGLMLGVPYLIDIAGDTMIDTGGFDVNSYDYNPDTGFGTGSGGGGGTGSGGGK